MKRSSFGRSRFAAIAQKRLPAAGQRARQVRGSPLPVAQGIPVGLPTRRKVGLSRLKKEKPEASYFLRFFRVFYDWVSREILRAAYEAKSSESYAQQGER